MSQVAPLPSTPLVVLPENADEYLGRMGVRVSQILEAITTGENAAGNTSSFAPTIAAGMNRWISTVEVLRKRLVVEDDWAQSDPQNRPIATDPTGSYQISVAGGDEARDDPDPSATPQAARKKGRATADSVDRNQQVLFGVGDLPAIALPLTATAEPPAGTWVLLYHRASNEIRCELSRPSGFDRPSGQFAGWDVRVLLEPIRDEAVLKPGIGDTGGGDVDFSIA